MKILQTQIRSHLERLIAAFELSNQEKQIVNLFDLLTVESLGIEATKLTPQWSAINNNGVPFQLVVSAGARYRGLRFLTEVGAGGLPFPDRLDLSYERLQQVCQVLGIPDQFSSIKKIGYFLLPQNNKVLQTLDSGALWIGLGFAKNAKPRLTVYFEGRWGRLESRWVRLFELLLGAECPGAATHFRNLIRPATAFSQPLGAAVDLDARGVQQIKLYFRTFKNSTEELSQLLLQTGIPGAESALANLTNTFISDVQEFPPSALVYYLAVSPSTDQIKETKIDVCTHCIGFKDNEYRDCWLNLAHHLNIDMDDYLIALDELSPQEANSGQDCHAFLGVGIDQTGKMKLNAYLRPSIGVNSKTVTRHSIFSLDTRTAVDQALNYLLRNQDADGTWRDFHLPPGRSDSWTTAYIGRCLLVVPPPVRQTRWRQAVDRAAEWLMKNISEDDGWGYNGLCGTDADSTANAVLFLEQAGWTVSDETYTRLWSFQQPDDGFSTYKEESGNGTWCLSHPDVTPCVVEALIQRFPVSDPRISRALRNIDVTRTQHGTWNSFWWSSFHYGTTLNLELLADLNRTHNYQSTLKSLQACPRPVSPFEKALLCRSFRALACTHQAASLVSQLQSSQLTDGSWEAKPMLRVTNNSCREPWTDLNPGHLYADDKRLLTTATVLCSLAKEK